MVTGPVAVTVPETGCVPAVDDTRRCPAVVRVTSWRPAVYSGCEVVTFPRAWISPEDALRMVGVPLI